jgi:adenine-specific DNA-methyltransferase
VSRIIKGYDYVKRGPKGKRTELHEPGLAGSFTYVRLGPKLFGEYREFDDRLPAFEELAKYIFYTETSQDFEPKAIDARTGRIGEHRGTAYYLLYTPNGKEDRALDLAWLKEVGKKENSHKLVVYCEKLWLHRDDLAKWERENGRTARPMVVPFNLK